MKLSRQIVPLSDANTKEVHLNLKAARIVKPTEPLEIKEIELYTQRVRKYLLKYNLFCLNQKMVKFLVEV